MIDGIFYSVTEEAVEEFQSDNGLVVDGIVGPNTEKELYDIEPSEPKEEEEVIASANTKESSEPEQESEGETMTMEATAYTADCHSCSGVTATGYDVSTTTKSPEGYGVVAVDPSVIPLGSLVEIDGEKYKALDTGGAINGLDADLLVGSHEEAIQFGRQDVEVTVLD